MPLLPFICAFTWRAELATFRLAHLASSKKRRGVERAAAAFLGKNKQTPDDEYGYRAAVWTTHPTSNTRATTQRPRGSAERHGGLTAR